MREQTSVSWHMMTPPSIDQLKTEGLPYRMTRKHSSVEHRLILKFTNEKEYIQVCFS